MMAYELGFDGSDITVVGGMPQATKIDTSRAAARWLAGIDLFLFDCDGVLWRGAEVVPRVPQALALLRRLVRRVSLQTQA